jgi:folate-binding protein YgfZ
MIKAATLPSRAVIRIGGPDARTFLGGLITQEPPAPGEAAFAALLTPQGKILFDFLIAADGDAFLLDAHADTADALVKRLMLYRLRARVTIERRADLAVGVLRAGAEAETPEDAVRFFDPRLLALGERVIATPATLDKVAGDLIGETRYERARLSAGVPEFGKDFASDEMFLLDVNYDALSGVSYKKGCFVGQEVTSRMKRKGEIRRRTLRLTLGGPPPPKGTPVTAGESTLGETMSGIEGAALALIRLDRFAAAREASAAIEAAGKPVRIDVPAYLEQG